MLFTLLLSLLCLWSNTGASQSNHTIVRYPQRVVRFVVPFSPGASNDVIARLLAQKLTERWGQQVVVDNRAGAGGMLGAEIVSKAQPDGYTLLMANPGANTINYSLRPQMPYQASDFAPVMLLGWSPILLVTGVSHPARNLKELIAMARARPGQFSGGSSGTGGSSHLALELFKMLAGVDILHVPYKGAGPAISDLVAGQLSLIFTTSVTAQPMINSGKLKALAVAGNQRLAIYPDIPTSTEQGLPGFEVPIWFGLVVPAQTPRPIIEKLNHDLQSTLNLTEIKDRFFALGLEPQGGPAERFGRLLEEDTARWRRVIKSANIKLD